MAGTADPSGEIFMAHETQPVQYEDMVGVRSRICWGAVLGGAVIALACSLVITFFYAAVGLSLKDADLRSETIGIGAIVAAVSTIVVSLFVGGWATTQLTAGETQKEAVLYGVITWAVVTAVSLGLVGMGVRAGYFAVVGGTMVAQNADPAGTRNWESTLRDSGVSQATIDSVRREGNADRLRAEANDAANQRAVVAAAWIGFISTMLSIGAAIGGSVVGCGPSFRLFPVAARRTDIIIAR